jgi:hypothetical protein
MTGYMTASEAVGPIARLVTYSLVYGTGGPLGKVADMPNALGYARISTDDQDLAGQVLRLKAAGTARTYEAALAVSLSR